MKTKKHLNFYKAGMIGTKHQLGGYMTYPGLCHAATTNHINYDLLHEIMAPTQQDLEKLRKANKNPYWWGSDDILAKAFEFTPLRQNIVLFMAAMGGEL